MTSENSQEKPEPRVIKAEPGVLTLTGFPVGLFVAANFADRWFADLVREAQRETQNATDSIRREIVFAVCFAESYIFEWAREVAGSTEVVGYFKLQEPFETVKQRWKNVPIRLHKAGLIGTDSEPNIDWGQMGEVTKYRDGLVHGVASIPRGLEGEEEEPPSPVPQLSELKRRGQGWALKAVLEVVEQLHQQTDTPVPDYVQGHLDSG